MDFFKNHILNSTQFNSADIEKFFQVTDSMRPYVEKKRRTRVLEGAILANIFFEPSTRTRISFGTAFNRLGGNVRETTEMGVSSLAKGESLEDSARILSGCTDVIVIRHPQRGAVDRFASSSRVPVINGGDGDGEHPTQALLDLYTIRQEMFRTNRSIEKLKIAIVGDLKHARSVHSLCKMLSLYKDTEYTLIAPKKLELPPADLDFLKASRHKISVTDQLSEGISGVDVVYVTRIQEERFDSQEEADHYRGSLKINQTIYDKYCAPQTIIMHPLPRDSRDQANELDIDLNKNPGLAIFRQADNAIAVRMAIFCLLFGVADQVEKHACPIVWNKA